MDRLISAKEITANLSSYGVRLVDYSSITSINDVFPSDPNLLPMSIIFIGITQPDPVTQMIPPGHYCLAILRDAAEKTIEFFDPLALGDYADACATLSGLEDHTVFERVFADYRVRCNTWGPQDMKNKTCGRWVIDRVLHGKMTNNRYCGFLKDLVEKGVVKNLDKYIVDSIMLISDE
jgi:hypothetical protein